MTGYMIGVGPCFTCRKNFAFDPDRVPSVPIDSVTGLAPDSDGARPDTGQYVKEPICPDCCKAINVERRKLELELMSETDTSIQ